MKDLQTCRKEIDIIDEQLLDLFEKRMALSKEVVEYKIENKMEIFQPEREKQVVEKQMNRLKNKEIHDFAIAFVQDLMTISKAYQSNILPLESMEEYKEEFKENPLVGYQGVAGAFSQAAVQKFFGEDTRNVGYSEFEDVFTALENGDIDYGVLPIENSLTGSINDNYDLIRKYGFNIVGEVAIPVSQCLMALPNASLEDIKQVYSHPQGLAQSSDFFFNHREMEPMPYKDTAMAARYVHEKQDITKAAIASPLAAKLYGLNILRPSIQNDQSNMTRFMVISKEMICPINSNKMSVMFTLNHEVGSLYNMLLVIKQSQINLVRIESRPMKEENWQYYFYIDFEGNIREERIRRAIEKMKANSNTLRILGNYVSNKE